MFPLTLFEVKSLRLHSGPGHTGWYDIRFKEGKSLAVTRLHAFVTVRNGREACIRTDRLLTGDKIWVDTSAFGADKSLHKTHHPTKED